MVIYPACGKTEAMIKKLNSLTVFIITNTQKIKNKNATNFPTHSLKLKAQESTELFFVYFSKIKLGKTIRKQESADAMSEIKKEEPITSVVGVRVLIKKEKTLALNSMKIRLDAPILI